MGSKGGDQTIGFKYYMSLHIGLCRGPIDEVVRINAGDIPAWPVPQGVEGDGAGGGVFPVPGVDGFNWNSWLFPDTTMTEVGDTVKPELICIAQGPNNTAIRQYSDGRALVVPVGEINTISATGDYEINAPEIFGGTKKEGGIVGSLRVMMGSISQTVPDWIKTLMGGRVPAFRGVATLFFDGMLTAMNPYPKKWAIRVRRTESGWDGDVWQPSLVTIWMRDGTIKAMNPAHIIYECLTNRDWGRGMPRDSIKEDAFLYSAQSLYNENFGLCLRYNRQSELSGFIQEVLDHIGGAIYPDRATGRLALDLLRGDYEIDDLPLFTFDTGLLDVENIETVAGDDIVNETIVKWKDPIRNEERSARVQNLAAHQAMGAPNSTTTNMSGISVAELALRVAQRDIKASATSLKRFKVTLDRRAWRIAPGKPFRISAPEQGIYNLVLRAGRVRESGGIDGKIVVEAVLDVFGLPAASFITPLSNAWTPPVMTPQVAQYRVVRESTYAELVVALDPANLDILSPDAGTIATVVGKPTSMHQAYEVSSLATGDTTRRVGVGSFAPYAFISTAISEADTVIAVSNGFDMGLVEVGSAIQIGTEICRLDDIVYDTLTQTGTITIARGCVDTIPQAHADGDAVFFVVNQVGGDGREYASGESVSVKILTYTSSGKLALALAPDDAVSIVGRQGKPYPPGKVQVNDSHFPINGMAGIVPDSRRLSANFTTAAYQIDGATVPQGTVLALTRASAATYIDSAGVVQSVASDVIRFDWREGTKALLVEPAATNLFLQSDDFSNAAWTKNGIVSTAVSGTGPGTGDAYLLTESAVLTIHGVAQAVTITSGETQTVWVIAKAAPGSTRRLGLSILPGAAATSWVAARFNLTTGAVLSTNAVGAGYALAGDGARSWALDDGWWLFALTGVAGTDTAVRARISLASADAVYTASGGGSHSYTGTTEGVLLAAAQFEAGADVTSYIATTTGTVTRAADVASLQGLTALLDLAVTYGDATTAALAAQSVYPGYWPALTDHRIRQIDGDGQLGNLVLTWTHRDRVVQQDQLIDYTAASIGPEAGTTYTVRVYNGEAGPLVRTASGIAGTTYTYTPTMATDDLISDDIWFEIESVRGGYVSFMKYRFGVALPVGYGTSGYGDSYGA